MREFPGLQAVPNGPPVVPPPLPRPMTPRRLRQNNLALKIMGWIGLALVIGSFGLGIFGIAAAELGMGRFIGAGILALLPIPVYATAILWLDRIEGEPPWMIATAFLWGATVAVLIAYVINSFFGAVMQAGTGNAELASLSSMVISAPLVEEAAKGLVLLLFLLFARREINGGLDGLVYGSMAGLGFAMTENIFYYGRALVEGGAGDVTILFVLRGVLFALSHPIFTTFTGIGIALSLAVRSWPARLLLIGGGYAFAVTAHFLWNSGAAFGREETVGMLTLYTFAGASFLLFVAGTALLLERSVLRRQLQLELHSGLLSEEEYRWAISLRRRLFGRVALMRIPRGVRRPVRRLMRISAELAFARHRLLREAGDAAKEEREFESFLRGELLDAVCEVRGAGGLAG